MKLSRIRLGSVVVAFFAGGVVGATFISLLAKKIEFEASVSISDMIQLLLTLIVAWFIGHILRQRTDDKRLEKDRLIQRTEELIDLAADVREVVQMVVDKTATQATLNERMRRLSKKTFDLRRKLETFQMIEDVESTFKKLEDGLEKYRHLLGEIATTFDGFNESEETRAFDALNDVMDCLVRDINRL